jgi:dienelactone hydrolase
VDFLLKGQDGQRPSRWGDLAEMLWPLDTVARRWDMLAPWVQAYGPADEEARPAVLLFHGCAGVRPHIDTYARAAARDGFRAFVIDSYEPRGWSQGYATTFVCSGAMFWGRERAGDVLAAVNGLAQDPGVDSSRIALAGWSHGAWSIMDLMTMPLDRPGEASLADPNAEVLAGVRSLFLAYPYGGPGALSRSRPWTRAPETFGVVAERDHITGQADALRIFDAARQVGAETHLWIAPGTHAFDAPGHDGFPSPMRYDPELAEGCLDRFLGFLHRTLESPAPAIAAGADRISTAYEA